MSADPPAGAAGPALDPALDPASGPAPDPAAHPVLDLDPDRPAGITPAALAALVALAEDAARAAGDLIRADGGPGRDGDRPAVASTKSSPTDVVTAMDRAVERLLRRRIASARPDDGLLGEEEGLRPGSTGLTWVLDPIDGTVNYLYGIPQYAVCVAAVTGDPRRPGAWSPVAACVHHAVTATTWTATLGGGARRDGRPLTLGPAPALDQALIATGFSYLAARRQAQARVFAEIAPHVRDLRRIGSAALDLCAVASGQLDGYYERGINVWDQAAAQLVLTEAGGVVIGLDGRPAGERTVLAAAPSLAAQLEGLLLEAGADDPEPAGGGHAGGS